MNIVTLFAGLLFLFSAAAYCADPIVANPANPTGNPKVEIKTNLGSMVLELYPDKAPKTVQNFLSYVKDDYYTGTVFHRVIDGFMIQGGGFDKTLKQKPTRQPIENEAANGLRNEIGTVAMARTSDPHSASAQFFINVANNSFLNHTARTQEGYGYTVFGKVVKGMDVASRIAGAPTGPKGPFPADVPNVDVVIEEIKLITAEPARASGALVK